MSQKVRIALLGTLLFLPMTRNGLAQTGFRCVYDWDEPGLMGWTNTSGTVLLFNSGGQLTAQFRQQKQPVFAADTVRTVLPAGVLLTNISFRLTARDCSPSAVRLCFRTAAGGDTWQVSLPPPTSRATVLYSVPLKENAGWRKGPYGTVQEFAAAMQSVAWVGIYIRRHGTTREQSYEIDSFEITGLQCPEDSDTDGMPDTWEVVHGLDPNNFADAFSDLDGDGMNNLAECRAGTDPTNANSLLMLSIALTNIGGKGEAIVLGWPSAPGRVYALWRAADPDTPLEKYVGQISASCPSNKYVDIAATNVARCFYWIKLE
ncbi:MAG: thrombospondin type 3 repeat-containing protein [Kiritimatiellia bacterium]